MSDDPRRVAFPDGATVDERCRRMADLTASRHATDPEPRGHVPDVDLWREANWRRAIPPRFRDATLEQVAALHGPDIAADLAGWVRIVDERPNLLLLGPVGTGKTFAGVAVLRAIHDLGATIACWPVTTFLEATSPGSSRSEEALASAIDSEVTMLDDLGMERGTEWVAERVYEVVNRRWLDRVPTIATSNAAPEGLADALGPRVWSRLTGNVLAVHLGGTDRRKATP